MLNLPQYLNTFDQCATVFFALLIGHAIADYPLQGTYLAQNKDRHFKNGKGDQPDGIWIHCLVAHSLIHAGFVWAITGRVLLGVVELILHVILDFAKCEKKTNYHTDQLLHIACKAVYVIALQQAWVS